MARPVHADLDDEQRTALQAARFLSIKRALSSDAEIARALGVNRSTIGRWRRGQAISSKHHEHVVALDAVIDLLSEMLEPESIPKWLEGFNAHLNDRRPLDVIRAGRTSEVIAAIEAQKSGAYA